MDITLHASGQASIEASLGVKQSGVASSPPLHLVASPDQEGVKFLSPSNENIEEENELSSRDATGVSKKTRREKQREKRRLKRASKRAATEVPTPKKEDEGNIQGIKKMRQRPTSALRSAATLRRMDQWSRLFLNRTTSLSSLTMDCATADAMSKAAEKTWCGKSRKRTFRSTQELDHFVSVKDEELRYLKTTLRRTSMMQQLPSRSHESRAYQTFMSSLEPLFRAWETDGEAEIGKDEVLHEAARFFTETIIPCLEAQLVQLRQRLNSARTLKETLDKAEVQLAHREEAEYRLTVLVEDQTYILPICPVWDKVGKEIDEIRRALVDLKSLADLREERDHIMLEYERSLEWE